MVGKRLCFDKVRSTSNSNSNSISSCAPIHVRLVGYEKQQCARHLSFQCLRKAQFIPKKIRFPLVFRAVDCFGSFFDGVRFECATLRCDTFFGINIFHVYAYGVKDIPLNCMNWMSDWALFCIRFGNFFLMVGKFWFFSNLTKVDVQATCSSNGACIISEIRVFLFHITFSLKYTVRQTFIFETVQFLFLWSSKAR